jgi:hypothetical protein
MGAAEAHSLREVSLTIEVTRYGSRSQLLVIAEVWLGTTTRGGPDPSSVSGHEVWAFGRGGEEYDVPLGELLRWVQGDEGSFDDPDDALAWLDEQLAAEARRRG